MTPSTKYIVVLLALALAPAWGQVPSPPTDLNVAGGTQVPPPAGGPKTGLDWNGTAPGRRMLYWDSPPPAYPLTIFFKVLPRVQVANSSGRHYVTFFHGNNGSFTWGSQYGNSFYGGHPYPIPAPAGDGKWEISSGEGFGTAVDRVTRDSSPVAGSNSKDPAAPYVSWNRWHSQAFVARNTTGTNHEHKFYVDLPSIAAADTITATRLSAYVLPPKPSIVMGQSPDNGQGQSWGGEVRWEEANEVIRGIQIYGAALTSQQILRLEACDDDACVLSVAATEGLTDELFYVNMNPKPSDVADKGPGHNDAKWEGTLRPALWTN